MATQISRQKTNHKNDTFLQNKSLDLLDILKQNSAASRLQPAKLESLAGQNWLQLVVSRRMNQLKIVSSCRKSSQPWDGVSCNSYPSTGTRVSRNIESVATRIQPPELESIRGWNQPLLVSSRWNSSQPQDGVSRNLYQPPEFELVAGQNQPQLVFRQFQKLIFGQGFQILISITLYIVSNQLGAVNFS